MKVLVGISRKSEIVTAKGLFHKFKFFINLVIINLNGRKQVKKA